MDCFSVDVSATARQSEISGQEAFAEFPVLEFLEKPAQRLALVRGAPSGQQHHAGLRFEHLFRHQLAGLEFRPHRCAGT